MQSSSNRHSSVIPVTALLIILAAAAAWLPALPTATGERVLALLRNERPEQTRIPDTLLLPRSESALLPHYAPWGWP